MTRERLTAIACLIGAAILIAIAFQCIPEPRTLTEAPTPTVRVIVLPSQTPFLFSTMAPSPTVTPREAILSTRVPLTPTPIPTAAPATATPSPNTTPPVQRG